MGVGALCLLQWFDTAGSVTEGHQSREKKLVPLIPNRSLLQQAEEEK